MFSKADADQLRQSIRSIKFLDVSTEPTPDLGNDAVRLYKAYKEYYGLNFTELDSDLAEVRSSIGTFRSGPYELVCQHFVPAVCPPRKTAFLLHGYFDHAGLYRHLIRHLLHRGIAVVIFDLPGHGLSSGATASIGSFEEYTAAFIACLKLAVVQRLHSPWVVIGQSTGSAVIIDALLEKKLQDGFSFQHKLLLGPLVRPRHWS